MKSTVDYSKLDDAELMTRITCAEPEALGELYERYHRLVFSLTLNSVADHATAEEITLDVFTRVWEKAETYRVEQAKVTTWLLSLARHRAIDVLRQRRTRLEQNLMSWTDFPAVAILSPNNPEEAAELTLRRKQVQTAIAQLPVEQKQALSLAYLEGYTHRQIAEILQEPLGTVKTRLRSAMQKLRQMLLDE